MALPAARGRRPAHAASPAFVLRIGPSSVALEGQLDPDRWPLDAAHHRFTRPVAEPQLTLSVRHGSNAAPQGRLIFQAGGVASIYRDGDTWIFRLGEEAPFAPADRAITLEPSGTTGSLVMDMGRSPELAASYPLEYPLEDLLFRHLLAERRALLVHACGGAWRRRGYLFVGSSGAGKSTTARLWRAAGATILNDDRIVLEASRDAIWIHPTPWFGEHPEVGGESVPLAALYLLRKGSEVAFEPIRSAHAAALVFAKSFPPLWDPERMGLTLEALGLICRQIPCGWLTVPPDPRAVTWVLEQR